MASGAVSGCARVYTGVADTRYLSVYVLRTARGNLRFDPPKLGDRPRTGELVAPLNRSLLLLPSPLLPTQLRPTGIQTAKKQRKTNN